MAADLRAHYGLAPSCLVDGSLSVDELVDLITWLPDDSALAASLAGGPQWMGWTTDRLLLRSVDQQTLAAVKKKGKAKAIPLPSKRRVRPREGRPGQRRTS